MTTRRTKALGVLLALALLASMLLVAAPASAANLAWSGVSVPSGTGNVVAAGSNVSVLAVAPDGKTMFAADNALGALYKSTNGGETWSLLANPAGAANHPLDDGVAISAIKTSPAYAGDQTVLVATQFNVWRSIDGGANWGRMGDARRSDIVGFPGATAVITSLDVAPNYATSTAVLVGVANTAAGAVVGGGVFLFTQSSLAWTDQGVNTGQVVGGVPAYTALAGGGRDVAAVNFSVQYGADGEIIAVVTDEVNTYVTTRFSARDWGAAGDILNATVAGVVPDVATPANPPASLAFPGDYDALNNNFSFLGIDTGAAGTGDLYRITGRRSPFVTSLATDLNIQGTATTTDISSVAATGAYASGILAVGWADNGAVSRSSNPSATSVSWTANTNGKMSGTASTKVVLAPDFATSTTVFAGTSGVQSAFQRSTDGGATFNAKSLVDTAVVINDMAVVDANTIYIATTEGAVAFSGVWKTVNGGTRWERVWLQAIAGGSVGMTRVAVSPAYPTDNTVFATEGAIFGAGGKTTIWKSTNAGNTWQGLNAGAIVTDWVIRGPDSLVTGGPAATSGQVYQTTNSGLTWTSATTPVGAAVGVNSLKLSPNNSADKAILVGGTDGNVYRSTDGGVTFGKVGGLLTGANVFVAFAPNYNGSTTTTSDKTIYAADSAGGIFRWRQGTDTAWSNRSAGGAPGGIAVAPNGTVYVTDTVAGVGVRRSVNAGGAFLGGGVLADAAVTEQGIQVITGSNVLYTLNVAGTAIRTFTDTESDPLALSGPADGASVAFNGPAGAGTVQLSWQSMDSSVTNYYVQVYSDSGFVTGAAFDGNTGNAGTSLIVFGLISGNTYYWRARVSGNTTGTLGAPLVSPFSSTRSFVMGLGGAPVAPGLIAPPIIAGTDRVSVTPNLTWTKLLNVTQYQIQLNDTPVFQTIIDQLVTGEAFQVPAGKLENSKTYYWRVRGVMGTSTYSEWSPVGIFTTVDKATPPPPPVTVTVTAPAPVITLTPPAPVTVTAPAVTVTAPVVTVTAPAPTITLPAPKPQPTPGWAWVVIVIGAILVIAVIVLVVRTRRVA